MASHIMHLYVGKYFKEKYKKITNLPQFYLGCIYPDSVNAFGFAPMEIRYPAHLRTRDIDEWYENNNIFYHQNTGLINEDLLLGFIIHNITDAAYDKHFSSIDREDWKRFNQEQSKKEWWNDEVLPSLKAAHPVSINGISETHVKEWVKNMTDGTWYNYPDDKPIVLTTGIMDELSEIVCNIAGNFINA